MRIFCLKHVEEEGPGSIADWAKQNGHHLQICRVYSGDPFPTMRDFDLLLLMGGPMSVNDQKLFPWISKEIDLIQEAIKENKIILGICLGAQLIAASLGGKICPNSQKEIGWFPIQLSKAANSSRIFSGVSQELTVFHWHGETFSLPAEATLLASSSACLNQAFSWGQDERVLGLQFHCEITPDIFASIEPSLVLKEEEFIQSRDTMLRLANTYGDNIHALMQHILERFTFCCSKT